MSYASPPPVPVRPLTFTKSDDRPAVPPLPAGYHGEEPLAAPRPQRLDPGLPEHMARTLDEQLSYSNPRLQTPQPPPGINYAPGFAFPNAPSFTSPPISGIPMIPMPQIHPDDGLVASMAGMSVNGGGYPPRQRTVSSISPALPAPQVNTRARALSTSGPQQVPRSSIQPSLTATLPTIGLLQSAVPAVQSPNADLPSKVAFIRDVLLLVNRAHAASTGSGSTSSAASIDAPVGPIRVDPSLQRLVDVAIPLLIALAPGMPAAGQTLSAPQAEALHIRASLTASGAFPAYIQQNQRSAFREFEAAARSNFSPNSWFRLGRDYESFGDAVHAMECFDRGARGNDESCLYRIGMVNLLGQLGYQQDYAKALPLLQRAAALATISVPQPAYVYSLLLLGDLSSTSIPLPGPLPPQLLSPLIPPGSSPPLEARKHLERAAYLHFTPAQYKLGHAYEFAEPPFTFDALLSVQYYSLASQAGEAQADLALSKWFLCGSDGSGTGQSSGEPGPGGFAKDEALAYTFAEKAAKKGLPSAEFAMGYYWEVGIGVPTRDVQRALDWYELAAKHGNADAAQRITALKKESSQALSRQQHDALTENKLVRKRTQAKARAEAYAGPGGMPPPSGTRHDANQVVNAIRKDSMMQPPFPQQQQQQQHFQQRQSSLTPQQQQSQGGRPSYGHQSPPPPGTVPSAQDPIARLRDRPRYSLADPGAGSASPPPGATGPPRMGATAGSGAGRGAGGRIVSGGYNQGSPRLENASLPPNHMSSPAPTAQQPVHTPSPAPSAGGTKYNTFADMGVATGKADEKDCVIM